MLSINFKKIERFAIYPYCSNPWYNQLTPNGSSKIDIPTTYKVETIIGIIPPLPEAEYPLKINVGVISLYPFTNINTNINTKIPTVKIADKYNSIFNICGYLFNNFRAVLYFKSGYTV